jgi:DNA polymerase-3 subunit gamma/tau
MSYLVLARRWRPKRFADLVGQDVVVRTLRNALASDSLAHAYLLTGIRGVGKTTIARLMAMAVNCAAPDHGEPCGACEACRAIAGGSSLDVQEMDAASHTGVDDVREILDGVRYPPTTLKRKVYIIDEAHMLSKSAFNALLKTLEEPPERVLFILATTEVEKLPITVRSRCQRFDLRRLGVDEISSHLGYVLGQESVTAEDAAVLQIARAADGSVRDALSLTERVLAYSGDAMEMAHVQQALGLIGPEAVRNLSEAIAAGDAAAAVATVREAMLRGHAPRGLLIALSELWHQLACVLVDDALLAEDAVPEERQWLQQARDCWSPAALDLRYQVLIHGLRDLGLVDEQRGVEMIAMRLCHLAGLQGDGTQQSRSQQGRAMDATPAAAEETRPTAEVRPAAEPAGMPVQGAPVAVPENAPVSETLADAVVQQDEQASGASNGTAGSYAEWQDAVNGYHDIRPGVAAMLDHVVCLEYGARVRLALDKHQQRAIAMNDRLEFAEWLGREVMWEALQDQTAGESLSQERERLAADEKRRMWEHAENDPHVQKLMQEMDCRLSDVRPAAGE